MALLVIVIGALLILGGASSLLAGFDITMTERGSAMTIAGTIALTGGVIAVAIGFSLLRLSQILNVLQTNIEEEVTPENSVVDAPPALVEVIPEPSAPLTKEIAALPKIDADDTILTSPLKPREAIEVPKKPGFFRRSASVTDAGLSNDTGSSLGKVAAGLATAGVATASVAGAAILSSGAASANETKAASTDELSSDLIEPLLPELDLTSVPVTWREAKTAEIALPVELPVDLEAELSRALAEDIPNSDIVDAEEAANSTFDEPEVITPPEPISFNEGLSQILAKPKKRGKKATSTNDSISEDELPQVTDENSAVAEIDMDETDSKIITEAELAADLAEEINVPSNDETLIFDEAQINATPNQSDSKLTILGTYNAGDGTYVMYSDGTVEAITEQGVRRFKSMEELRAHLAQQ